MPTAFILTRYSTDNQNPDTTAVQVKKCAEYCRQHQLTVLDIFSDEAVSGMKLHRPKYDRMMAAFQAKAGADVVVIYDQSRMFRERSRIRSATWWTPWPAVFPARPSPTSWQSWRTKRPGWTPPQKIL